MSMASTTHTRRNKWQTLPTSRPRLSTTSCTAGRSIPNSEVFSVSLWVKEDVETVVPSDKVDEFMRTKHKYFDDCLTNEGFELLSTISTL